MDTVRFNAHVLHKVFEKRKFSTCVVITFQVMAFAGMSPGHPDAVGTLPEGRQGEFGAHAAGAGYSDDPDIGRVLHPADPRKVGSTVTAPVAKETHDFRFPFRHDCKLLSGFSC